MKNATLRVLSVAQLKSKTPELLEKLRLNFASLFLYG